MLVAACVKWVDLNPTVDPLHGTVEPNLHGAGLSDADQAAVETALRLAEAWQADSTVVCVGPAAAEPALRELLAVGIDHAVRVQATGEHGSGHGPGPGSADVARLLAAMWTGGSCPPEVVVCGDASLDRGSGSVPAYLAHELGAAQALGLVEVDPVVPGGLEVLRRLDGGRRERLRLAAPAVISVEGSVARLRRASLAATLATRDADVEVRVSRVEDLGEPPRLRPWRPRPRALPGPAGDSALERIVALTGALVDRTPPRTVVLDPPGAAAAIIGQLREWGYLPPDD